MQPLLTTTISSICAISVFARVSASSSLPMLAASLYTIMPIQQRIIACVDPLVESACRNSGELETGEKCWSTLMTGTIYVVAVIGLENS